MDRPEARVALLALTTAVGGAIALQVFVNGRLGAHFGSAEAAAALNNAIGLGALVALAFGSGGVRRTAARLRAGARPSPWYFLGGLGGASLVAVSAAAAPEVGVALVTVALVCGQAGGSLVADGAGMSPAGRRPPTAPRIVGTVLAVAAVAVSALGARGDLQVGLLLLAVGAGIAAALQQAANGHLVRVSGEPLVAGAVNFAVGFLALSTLAFAVTGGAPDGGWSAPPELLVGGLLGAAAVTVSAAVVGRIGVLLLSLCITAGQTAGALVIDLIAPAEGEAVTAGTVVGVVLAVTAVAISGRR